ncbi:MAG: hypothetical protein RL563_964 [Pseudomonadota bacterium]|jgi:membrane protein YqaA with SNARE-associated domain
MEFQDFGLFGLFASAFISSTIAPGGSELVLVILMDTQSYSLTQLVSIASIGNTLGALTTWWLGVWVARKHPVGTLLSDKHQRSLCHVQRWGNWALLFSWLPLVGDGLCFASGWLRLSFMPALLAITIGKTLRYLAVAYTLV